MAEVILFGAGASVEIDVPAAFQMTDQLLEAALETGANDGQVYRILDFVRHVLSVRNAQASPTGDARVNVEDLYSSLEMLAERDVIYAAPFIQDWQQEVAELDEPLRGYDNIAKPGLLVALEWLFGHIKRWTIYGALEEGSYYHQFAQRLAESANRENITLATVNYDNGVELGAKHANLAVSDGYDNWKRDFEFDFGHAIPLLKLHGSTTWGLGLLPTVVFGSGNKLRYYGPFLDLLDLFRRRLYASSTLRVIGYSFGDEHINELVRRWEAKRADARLVVGDLNNADVTRRLLVGKGLGRRSLEVVSGPASTLLPQLLDL